MGLFKKVNLLIFVFLTFGFRTYFDENRWETSNDNDAAKKLFVVFDEATTAVPNDVGEFDPAFALGGSQEVSADRLSPASLETTARRRRSNSTSSSVEATRPSLLSTNHVPRSASTSPTNTDNGARKRKAVTRHSSDYLIE